jgi:hypothetical protein|tara:strand:+ start:468 stop:1001 length:534 start_codon:yes stop_codon:yes gene_type:complete
MSFRNIIAKVFGDVPHGTTDADETQGGGPVKVGGQARTTNPASVGDADRVNFIADDVGRQVNYPYQVRDLITSGHASLTRSQEASVITGNSAAFLDLVYVSGQNTSDVAITVNLRYGSGNANHIDILEIPANDTAVKTYPTPYPQSEVDSGITAQLAASDASDSPVTITALAVQNID